MDTFRYWKAKSLELPQRLNDRAIEIQRIQQEFGYCAIPDDDDTPAPLPAGSSPAVEGTGRDPRNVTAPSTRQIVI